MDAKPKRIRKPLTEEQKERKRARDAAYRFNNRDKLKASAAAYRENNREKLLAHKAAWYKANIENERARRASFYAANREKLLALNSAWKAANREKVRAHHASWRAANREKLRARMAAYYVANPLTAEQKQHAKNEERKRRLIRKQARLFAGMALLANTIQASQLGGGTHGCLSDGRDAVGRSPMDARQHSEASQAHAGLCPKP